MDSQAVIAAATRFHDAWNARTTDITEMHEAVMGLIWITGTSDLEGALAVLAELDG